MPGNVWKMVRGAFLFVALALIVCGVSSCGGEREGYVETGDCREIVWLNDNDFDLQKLYYTFTCTASGAYRTCQRIEMESGKCRTVYIHKAHYQGK